MNFAVYDVSQDRADPKQDDRELVGETKDVNSAMAIVEVVEEEHAAIEASERRSGITGPDRWVVVVAQKSRKEGGGRLEITAQHYHQDQIEAAWRSNHEAANTGSRARQIPEMPADFRIHRWHGLIQLAGEFGSAYEPAKAEALKAEIREDRAHYASIDSDEPPPAAAGRVAQEPGER